MKGIMKLIVAFLITSFTLFSANILADPGQGRGQGQGQGMGKSVGNPGRGNANVRAQGKGLNKPAKFLPADRNIISDYAGANAYKGTALPPGVAMNVARGKPLPPGIAKRDLPADLVAKLPTYPGYRYVAIGDDVVLVNNRTGIVDDILTGVLK